VNGFGTVFEGDPSWVPTLRFFQIDQVFTYSILPPFRELLDEVKNFVLFSLIM
jgi:hypothetical protein